MIAEKKQYTPKFKMEAVGPVTEQAYKTTEAARNLGIHLSVLNRWKDQLTSEGKNAFPGKGHLPPEKGESRWSGIDSRIGFLGP